MSGVGAGRGWSEVGERWGKGGESMGDGESVGLNGELV